MTNAAADVSESDVFTPTGTFLEHTDPAEDFRKMSGLQFMSESSWSSIWLFHTVLTTPLFCFGLKYEEDRRTRI
ncbi:hypothetical protein F2P81_020583 [Scophthalmus maximus]|uniref:Uncharacterized protein n=1 Tax=Scophthalmus maximus TaxID=52904 RepID=A0A6A4SAR3_SCOMX|nr:hypothetical protein F2P81_020583 [Scophthalmus maximus]